MFAPNRLRAASDFERARNAGRSWGHRLLSLQAVQTGGDVTRCGFVVSKRVSLKSVVRNRVRRRLREIVRRLLPQLQPGFDLVLAARPAAVQATYDELEKAVRELLARSKVLQAS